MARAKSAPKESTANIGFEAKLWLAADKLRNNMDAAEYKHVVLGLIFHKYISDSFEEHRAKLTAGKGDYAGANPEDPDEYRAETVFWVPADARWSHLQASAKQPSIGKTVDDAMVAIERDNPRLKGVLPKDYARPALDKHRLGELIDLIGSINLVDRAPSPRPSPTGRGGSEAEGEGAAGLGRGAGDEGLVAFDKLFPDSFQDSDLGEVLRGWRLGTLGELVRLRTDRVDATPDKDYTRYIALEDMPSKSIDLSNVQLGSAVNSSITAFRKGDVLFGSMRPYFHKVGLTFFDGITRTTTFVLRPRKDCFRHFALLHFFSDDVVAHATTASVGTTIPYVKWDSLESYRIPMPPDSLLEAFEKMVSPLVERIAAQGEESRTLATLRDTLLPKLLSGEVNTTNIL